MAFYEDISKYYDYIFPSGQEQVKFISEIAGKPPKALLDIACGTGGYSLELAAKGYELTAADIDAKMVERLKEKTALLRQSIKCIQAGMLELQNSLKEKFDLAFCIGNSVVHLDGEDEMLAFFKSVRQLLKKDGSFILQIINFDRVILKDIKGLPPIKNEEVPLLFERYYRFDRERNRVFFRTVLSVEGKRIENEIPLSPLMCDDAVEMLKAAGFNKIKLFGDFNGNEFDRYNSYMLVIRAF